MDDRGYFGNHGKREAIKKYREKYEILHKEIRKKNEMKPKRSGSTSLSMGIDSSKGINFNTWALKSQTGDVKL